MKATRFFTTNKRASLTASAVKRWRGARGSLLGTIGGRRRGSTRRRSELREAGTMVEVVEGSTTEVGVEATIKEPRDTVEVVMAEMGSLLGTIGGRRRGST